ncbi:hypothetical protein [Fulvivirga ligni]|uniref:hypothetical protein n=1 Tax=Fulvivirga ligni TaxID=2904246 RepID=UPI001F3E4474|nr:hypothetical protein [Fulvivirga ligni]UII24101.1 hypothetical protein LVD16_12820 [Fulvivirga ligni]
MNSYIFETKEFGLSDEGIHLLRDRFNYKSILFSEILKIEVKKGKELKNWGVIFTIGLGLVLFFIYYSVKLYLAYVNGTLHTIYIEQIVIPVIPLLFGAYCVYNSLQNGTIMYLRTIKGKRFKLSLKSIEKDNQLQDFRKFISRLGSSIIWNA